MDDEVKELIFGIVLGALFQVFTWTFFNKRNKK